MSFIRVAPLVETALFPCAEGREIDWGVDEDGRIHITQAVFWKSDVCEYRGLTAQAGRQNLAITFTRAVGNRPGGEFEAKDIYIEAPFEPVPVKIALEARHRWNPLWLSRSKLFSLDYEPLP